ncbi:hypothetical protein F6P88_09275 [Streptococcus suis]|nr:hypothetical protein [Streptococcus suis]MBS8114559.1 hypothetical protein [Streptococcus suis]
MKYNFQRASKILCLEAADNPFSLSILESVGSSVKDAGKWLSLKFTYKKTAKSLLLLTRKTPNYYSLRIKQRVSNIHLILLSSRIAFPSCSKL